MVVSLVELVEPVLMPVPGPEPDPNPPTPEPNPIPELDEVEAAPQE
ncbi:MAG TPA: hypothetical protein V6C76_10895 [Drouetiella sp.]